MDEIGPLIFILCLGIPKLLGTLPFSDFKMFICDTVATLRKNLVNFVEASIFCRIITCQNRCMLFNAYCKPIGYMYRCQLWNIAYRYNYDRLCVAFNDAFRLLLDVPRWTGASSLFVLHGVPTFAAVIRKLKLTYSLYDCIRKSSNSLLIAYMESVS